MTTDRVPALWQTASVRLGGRGRCPASRSSLYAAGVPEFMEGVECVFVKWD